MSARRYSSKSSASAILSTRSSRRSSCSTPAPLGRQDRRAHLGRDAQVEHRPGRRRPASPPSSLGQRRALRDERAAPAPAGGDQVAALHQRRDGQPQCRARDAELVGEAALRRQAAAGEQQSEADRRAQPLHRLLEHGGQVDRFEHALESGVALHGRKGTAPAPFNARGPARSHGPSRSQISAAQMLLRTLTSNRARCQAVTVAIVSGSESCTGRDVALHAGLVRRARRRGTASRRRRDRTGCRRSGAVPRWPGRVSSVPPYTRSVIIEW